MKASQGGPRGPDVGGERDSGLCMDPDLLVPPRELWDFTGLHVFLRTETKVVWCEKPQRGTLGPKVKKLQNCQCGGIQFLQFIHGLEASSRRWAWWWCWRRGVGVLVTNEAD